MRKTTGLALIALRMLPLCGLPLLVDCAPDWSSMYGVSNLKIGNQVVYFKREVRGLSYDSLALSTNGNPCERPNGRDDYRYHVQGPITLFYKVEENTLILYGRFTATPPEGKQFPIKVVQLKPDVVNDFALEKKALESGFTAVDVTINENIKCN